MSGAERMIDRVMTTRGRSDGATRIERIVLRRLRLPLKKPYSTAYGTFHEFEPILAEAHLADGNVGWGEGQIAPGSSGETREGGWQAALSWADRIAGRSCEDAQTLVLADRARSPVAATALVTSMEMARGNALLEAGEAAAIPLLIAVSGKTRRDLEAEIEAKLADGFRTFKVKVGPDVASSLRRVGEILAAVRGRGKLRLDANRSFGRADAIAFAAGLDPDGIELFEQPCAANAWDDNAAVAARSPVPLMLDESICSLADIERAGTIPGIAFCKLKLKRLGSLDGLRAALRAVVDHGMRPVLGDGLSSDLGCWMEASAGADLMHGAGEFNGFLKPFTGLLSPALTIRAAHLEVPAGFAPTVDAERLEPLLLESREVRATQSTLPSS